LLRELAARFPGEVPDLSVARPTLEDVYLRMIGEQAGHSEGQEAR
jgi:ABC-2 type transport system ATP-binding protein